MFFSKRGKGVPAAPHAPSLASAKSSIRSPGIPSIISADLVVHGTLVSAGDIQIDGRLEGGVRSARLVVGDAGEIHGDVVADEAIVRGRVIGNIRARKIQFCSTSRVTGVILHKTLEIERGAQLDCNCRHVEDPLAEVLAPKTAGRTTVQTALSAIISKPAPPVAAAIGATVREPRKSEEVAVPGTAPLEAPAPHSAS